MKKNKNYKILSSKKAIYAYEIYEGRDGQMKIRNISNKKDANFDNAIFSKKTPKERKQMQDLYNAGFAGISEKTGTVDYTQTIEWGMMGGRPKIYQNKAAKQKAYRLRKKNKSVTKGI